MTGEAGEFVLSKILRDGKTRLDIRIVPYGGADSSAHELVLSRDGEEWTRTRRLPRRLDKPADGGCTHGLPIGDRQAAGLTGAEARTVESAVERHRKDQERRQAERIENERAEAEAAARAAAPGVPTFTVSGPYGAPAGIGHTVRLDDGQVVTGLRTWKRYYREDGWSFGVMDESGYLYFSEVRDATASEREELERREARQARREELARRGAELARAGGEVPEEADVPGLWALPSVRTEPGRRGGFGTVDPFVHFRVDEPGGFLWVLTYNGADGDDWSRNNFGAYVACRMPLTAERAALAEELRAEFGAVEHEAGR